MKIKTRFAPSPTGYLHVGSARTLLYSWLFARNKDGKFVLRIEDTDLERSKEPAVKTIMDSINWLNLDWDEGPYFQTKRLDRYNAVIGDMLKKGTAYKCYCSKERLKLLRTKQIERGEKPRYDYHCREISKHHIGNKSYVVRFRSPQEGSVIFNDLIRGSIRFNNQELDDLIICRADGSPTYNFCVVVDDYDMAITHVIRGADHINNTPRQINILKALGAPVPNYAHVPMILGDDGKNLSKRHGAVSIMEYRDNGFLPEALTNHLVRLGWSHGNQEIFSIEEMKELFSVHAISKSASEFNIKKLLWTNHYYIKQLSKEHVAKHLMWHLDRQRINTCNGPKPEDLINLFRNRCKTLKEIVSKCHYFYQNFSKFDDNAAERYLHAFSTEPLNMVRRKLARLREWTIESVHTAIQETAKELNVKIDKVGMPLRVAVTGSDQSPALDVTVYFIGQSRSLFRIDMALSFIERIHNQ